MKRCCWCNLVGGDCILHYLTCGVMLEALARLFPELSNFWCVQLHPPCRHQLSPVALGFKNNNGPLMIQIVIWHDVCFHAYTSARNGSFEGKNWVALFTARRRVYARYAPMIHELLVPRVQVHNSISDS